MIFDICWEGGGQPVVDFGVDSLGCGGRVTDHVNLHLGACACFFGLASKGTAEGQDARCGVEKRE